MRKPILHFKADINEKTINQLIACLRSCNSPDTVVIDSPGGSFDFFSTRGPIIKRLGITTIANHVYSAATILFILGAERIVHRESEILLHEVRVITGNGQHVTVSDVDECEAMMLYMQKSKPPEMFKEWQRQMHNAQEWFVHFVADHTHCPVYMVRNLLRAETVLTGKEAYQYGLATKFAEVRFYE